MNGIYVKCPECGGKTKTIEIATTDNDDVLRKKECKQCRHTFYTAEKIVSATNEFLRSWYEFLGIINKETNNDRN